MNICFDWDGTLAKKEVAEEASIRRAQTIGFDIDRDHIRDAMKTNSHYKINKEMISKYTGVVDERELTVLMTDIFRYHYLGVVNEWREAIFLDGVMELLIALKRNGHTLSIASTLRQDILEYSLQTVGMRDVFSTIKANTPDLIYSKEDLIKQVVQELSLIDFMIGDRQDDILAGKSVNAKTIFVTYGAEDTPEDQIADYHASAPDEILDIITRMQ